MSEYPEYETTDEEMLTAIRERGDRKHVLAALAARENTLLGPKEIAREQGLSADASADRIAWEWCAAIEYHWAEFLTDDGREAEWETNEERYGDHDAVARSSKQ